MGFEVASCPACSGSDVPCLGYGPMEVCFTQDVPTQKTLPGHRFSGTVVLGRGFSITSFTVAGIMFGANVLWHIDDVSAAQFTADLDAALTAVLPAGADVTVTAPATVADPCVNNGHVFTVAVACIEDPTAPLSVAVVGDAGGNLLLNPGFDQAAGHENDEFPQRQQIGGFLLCTNVANRGWETNDVQQQFETWNDLAIAAHDLTPTPNNTRIIEINAQGRDVIWQTIVIPAAGSYTVEITFGGRDRDENLVVALSAGDTNSALPGTVFSLPVAALNVSGQSNPWTLFSRTEVLAAGTYTLAIRGPVAGPPDQGGLMTNARLVSSAAGTSWNLRRNACAVVKDVMVPTTTCEIWQPAGAAATCVIETWTRLADGTVMTNDEFFTQVPAPSCCPTTSTPEETTPATTPAVIESHAVTATFAAPWTPAQVPSGVLVGLTVTVMSGTAQITDVDGTGATATVGTVLRWTAPQETGQLIPPTLVSPAAAGNQTLVAMEVRT